MKGKLKLKKGNWFVRTITEGRELDEINFEYYPLSFSESQNLELKDGLEVEFKVIEEVYTDLEGLGQDLVSWAVIL